MTDLPEGFVLESDLPKGAKSIAPPPGFVLEGAEVSAAPEAAGPEVGAVEGGMRAFARGVPVVGAFLDEANAATGAALDPLVPQAVADALGIEKLPGDFSERYAKALEQQRGMDKSYDKANPVLSPTLQVAGGVAGSAAALAAAPGAASTVLGAGGKTLVGKVAAGTLSGAGLGGLHGFGSGEGTFEDRLVEGGKGAAVGGVLGAAFPLVAAGLGKTWNAFTKTAAPTLKALKAQSQALYKKADKIGLTIAGDSAQTAFDDMATALKAEGFHPKLHPKVAVALDELTNAATGDIALKDVQILQRIAQSASKSVEPDERRVGGILVDMLDDYLENLKPDDVLTGNPQVASDLLKQAKTLWGRYRKGETIERLLETAELTAPNFSGSGAENAVRTEFRNLAKQLVKDPRKARLFTAEERKAITKVAKGGPLGNALRLLGKLAPTGSISGYVAMAGGGTIGGAVGGPIGGGIGAVTVPAIGGLARKGATAVTLSNARAASEMVRSGGKIPMTAGAKTLADYAQKGLQGSIPALSQQATPMLPFDYRTSP